MKHKPNSTYALPDIPIVVSRAKMYNSYLLICSCCSDTNSREHSRIWEETAWWVHQQWRSNLFCRQCDVVAITCRRGRLAHLARAPHWRCGGERFESSIAHQYKESPQWWLFVLVSNLVDLNREAKHAGGMLRMQCLAERAFTSVQILPSEHF